LRSRGRSEQDAFLLRQAAHWFDVVDEKNLARECRADADYYGGRCREAGQAYLDLGMPELALDCFWRGDYHEAVKDLGQKFPSVCGKLEYRATVLPSPEKDPAVVVAFLNLLETQLSTPDINQRIAEDKMWHHRGKSSCKALRPGVRR
jgi:hypothetical protein